MKNSIQCILGLQLPKQIDIQEIKDLLYAYHLNLNKSDLGKIVCATIHKKHSAEQKSILVVSLQTNPTATFENLLKQMPNLHIFKRYILTDIALLSQFHSEIQNFSYEKFASEIESTKTIFYPEQPKPACILKSIYHHFFCIDGDVIWYNNTPINISKGKYFARQLYCEYHIDSIKTTEGYKVPAEATITVTANHIMPRFQNKQIVLPVEEYQCPNKHSELLSNHFKIVVN